MMHFFGCQGHVFAGVDRQPFALVPAYGMGDNGRHNRWVSNSYSFAGLVMTVLFADVSTASKYANQRE